MSSEKKRICNMSSERGQGGEELRSENRKKKGQNWSLRIRRPAQKEEGTISKGVGSEKTDSKKEKRRKSERASRHGDRLKRWGDHFPKQKDKTKKERTIKERTRDAAEFSRKQQRG